MQPSEYNAAFEAFLQTLNPEQQQAVQQIDGPLMVVAGPGTGKTQVLAARIGRILLETDTPASAVLCLTFSDAGAHAMRHRLLQLIGPEAHRVPISTFHSFCNRIIQENLIYFGNPHLTLITELERIERIRELLLDLPLDNPLRAQRKDPFVFEAQVQHLFAVMKKEGWSAKWMHEHIGAYVQSLPQNPQFVYKTNSKHGKKGDPKTRQIEAETQKMARLRAAVDLYAGYQTLLEKTFRYEYDDMLLWVIDAFNRHEALLRACQERYLYILVDEYQDTNGAQFRLLQQLLDYWEQPNVFIVGDDDQSVYEFQGARLQNLIDFQTQYAPHIPPLVMRRNYRSGQNLLDAAGRVIEHNALRAVRQLATPVAKNLLAQTVEPAELRVLSFENRLHEWTGVVARIGDLIDAGVPPEHIAVLYTRHRQGEPLQRLLQQRRIATQVRRPVNVLQLPMVEQFLDLLRYIGLESRQPFGGEGLLFRLLHTPFWNIPPIDLALLALYRQEQDGAGGRLHWRVMLQTPEHLEAAGVSSADRLLEAGRLLESWIAQSATEALSGVPADVWTRSGLLEHALQHPDRVWLLQALGSFQVFVEDELLRRPGLRLPDLTGLVDRMHENRLELPMRTTIQPREGVHLLTAHAAKGLEFEYVFMPDCSAESWEPSTRLSGLQFSLPDSLLPSGEEDALEARRRLFYVAMTRARRGLFLSHSRFDGLGKPIVKARFLDETGLPTEAVRLGPAEVLQSQAALLQAPEQPVVHLPESAWLEQRLEQFTLSITAMNRYLRCPLAFYYEDLLRVPTPMRPAAAFGQAVHAALQHYFLRQPQGGPSETLLRDFESEMNRRRGFFAPEAFLQQKETGKNILLRFHRERAPHWKPKAVVEHRIDRCHWKNVPLTGAIDRIEWMEGELLALIDFKTGKPDRKKAQGPTDARADGGEFWRQLLFYHILLRESKVYAGIPIHQGSISWVEPDPSDKLVTETLVYQERDVAFMENRIETVYAAIRDKNFDTGCGLSNCPWCTMHRIHSATAQTASPEDEILDDDGYLRAKADV